MVEHGALRNQSARTAIHRDAFEITPRVLSRWRDFVEIENEIVGEEQVEASIAVVVHPGAACAPAIAEVQQACRLRHVGESAVAVVAIQNVLRPAGDENVVAPVVVVVGDGHAAGPALA